MSIPELIVLVLFLILFGGGFIYCLFKETKSNCEFRKRLISHMDRLEQIITIKDEQ